ncbi:MAG: SLATT domain-containing protein, partial [Aggregatilineales bacterium]
SENYISTRVVSQRNWYIKKLRADYLKLRKTRFAILIFAGIGAVIAGVAIQWAFVVVITTAMVTAITTWMQLEMQGQTYGHYNLTANTLDEMLSEWYILSDEQRMRPEILAKLVFDVEGVLENEELAWMQQAIQSQMLAQQSMERSLTSLSGSSRYDDSESTDEWARIRQSLDDSYYALSTGSAAQSVIPPGMDDDTEKTSVG